MIDLHDSHGRHIANFVSGQLHDVQGRNIGHYLENEGIFINMQGYYLLETLYLIFDYPYKYYTFKHFEV